MQENKDATQEFDVKILCPDSDAKAEPFHAIMEIDENGANTGHLWGTGNHRLMLFESMHAAQMVLEVLQAESQKFEIRGVTAAHLDSLKKIEAQGQAELFVVVGITPAGRVEALPLAEHDSLKNKAGNPPPIPGVK